jgi:hypothetical protein
MWLYRNDRDETQMSWLNNFTGFLKDMEEYIKNNHRTGLSFTGQGEAKPGIGSLAHYPCECCVYNLYISAILGASSGGAASAPAAGGPKGPPPMPKGFFFYVCVLAHFFARRCFVFVLFCLWFNSMRSAARRQGDARCDGETGRRCWRRGGSNATLLVFLFSLFRSFDRSLCRQLFLFRCSDRLRFVVLCREAPLAPVCSAN